MLCSSVQVVMAGSRSILAAALLAGCVVLCASTVSPISHVAILMIDGLHQVR